MSRIDEQLSDQFYKWERRGRGLEVFGVPVKLEPPFRPFEGHYLTPQRPRDDGRRHSMFSGFIERLQQKAMPQVLPEETEIEEPPPLPKSPSEIVELQLTLPVARPATLPQIESFLRQACRASEPITLEILGTASEIVPQFAASPNALRRLQTAIEVAVPNVVCIPGEEALHRTYSDTEEPFAVVELGLGSEFMVPLGDPRTNLLSEIVSALESLEEGETGLFQIMFEPVRSPWRESIRAAVSDHEGQAFFSNRPELLRAAETKIAQPLFAVVLRLAASAASLEQAWSIITDMAAPLSALSRPQSNFFVPLQNDGYCWEAHEQDVMLRRSRRPGMILNVEELAHLITLPTSSPSRRLRRDTAKTQRAPDSVARSTSASLFLGDNLHAGVRREVWLSPEQRVRHMHVVGASGTGKSTLLLNLIQQDIENGQGVGVFDPHGDVIDKILSQIPSNRTDDVVLIDPGDEEFSVGFNILAAHSDFEKSLLASDLIGVFERLSTSWGDQMNSVLRNAILAFLESTEGGTLADLRRFLLDPGFRAKFLETVTDPEVVYYWKRVFPQLTGNKSVGPVATRLDEFLSRKPIRYMVSQKENRVNFSEVLDKGRILLAKLSQGEIGKENSYLLGSLLLSKIQQTAMSRQRIRESERRDFWCYVDEFHCFITPSMAEILTGARKYRVGLVLAHQELRQMQSTPEVGSAVLANPFTRIVFRVGDADARALESGFSHFEASDLQNLETGQAIGRVEKSDDDFNLVVRPPDKTVHDPDARREAVIAASRQKYARSRIEIEAELLRQWKTEESQSEREGDKKPKSRGTVPPQETAPVPREEPPAVAPESAPVIATVPEKEFTPQVLPTEAVAVPPIVWPPADTRKHEEPASVPAAASKAESAPLPPKHLGRGGAQHQAIQLRIKTAAEEFGFRSTLEKEILRGRGSVDVYLERQSLAIACEISVTTTIDHEVGNVSKCFRAGITAIAVVSPEQDRLEKIQAAVTNSLGKEVTERTRYFLPDAFIEFLRSLPVEAPPPAPGEEVRRGYKVKRNVVTLTDEERAAREQEAIRVIGENLRKGQDPSHKMCKH